MDDPKQVIDGFVEELWNERRLEVADAIFAKDCVTHQLRSGGPTGDQGACCGLDRQLPRSPLQHRRDVE
jgi:hypothetical protein